MTDEIEDPEDPVASLLGALLVRRLRLRSREKNLERVAERVGLSARTLQRYEKGRSTPPPKTLDLLARQAGFPPTLLDRLQGALEAHRLTEGAGLAGDEPTSPREDFTPQPFAGGPFGDEVVAAVLKAVAEVTDLLAVEPAPAPRKKTGRPRPEDRGRG